MLNEFKICNKCRATNIDSLKNKILKLDPNAKIVIGCQNMCGIGRTKSFCILNHIPIIAENETELIKKIENKIHN